jgi:hypothetical protein
MPIKYFLFLSFLMLCVAVIVCRAEPVRIIDLTQASHSGKQDSLRMPGASYGSGGRVLAGPVKFYLSITIKVDSVSVDNEYVDLKVLLRNIGHGPFTLPIGRDSDRIHQDGNEDRRTFLWLLAAGTSSPSRVIASTVSSSSLADSYVILKPQEAIMVKLRAKPSVGDEFPGKGRQIFVTCKQWNIDDRAFVINAESAIVKASPVIATKD